MATEKEKAGYQEAGSMAINPLGFTIGKFIEHGVDLLSGSDAVTFRDIYPQGTVIDTSKPIPLMMIAPPGMTTEELTGLNPTLSTPPLVEPAKEVVIESQEGVQEVDSWAWTQKLMEIRQQVAATEGLKLSAEPNAVTTQVNLSPLILLGVIGFFVVEEIL